MALAWGETVELDPAEWPAEQLHISQATLWQVGGEVTRVGVKVTVFVDEAMEVTEEEAEEEEEEEEKEGRGECGRGHEERGREQEGGDREARPEKRRPQPEQPEEAAGGASRERREPEKAAEEASEEARTEASGEGHTTKAEAAEPKVVGKLAELLSTCLGDYEDYMDTATKWCEDMGFDSVERIICAESEDAFVHALGLKDAPQNTLLRKELAKLRKGLDVAAAAAAALVGAAAAVGEAASEMASEVAASVAAGGPVTWDSAWEAVAALKNSASRSKGMEQSAGVPAKLLADLQDIEQRCKGADTAEVSKDAKGNIRVECLLQGATEKLWVCTAPGCPEVTACVWARLSGVTQEEIVFAITDVQERLKWDSDSFRSYEIVRTCDQEDPSAGEVIYCVIPAPRPLSDRDMLQRRWTLALPGGGWAMVCQSIKEDALKAPRPEYVRAFTHISGYLLRPVGPGCEVELTIISRCDLGGSIPTWAQNLVRRLAKQKPVAWARKLGEHCKALRKAGAKEEVA